MSRVLHTRSERLLTGDRIHAGSLMNYADQALTPTVTAEALNRPVTVVDVAMTEGRVHLHTDLFDADVPAGVLVGRILG